jgi:hypothetical protein
MRKDVVSVQGSPNQALLQDNIAEACTNADAPAKPENAVKFQTFVNKL